MTERPGDGAGRIVVGVDGSPPSQWALRWGAHLAVTFGAGLDAVIAWELTPTHSWSSTPPDRSPGEYIRQAREAGRSWEVIGDALGLLFLASANKIGVGEQAYDYALAYDTSPGPRRYTWPCPACRQVITDQGPFPEVPGQDEGHDPACTRRAAGLAAWEEQRSGR